MTDDITTKRLEAFTKVCTDLGVLEDENYSGYEDAMEYIDGEKEIGRFAVVTSTGGDEGYPYVKTADTLDGAKAQAVENVSDSIYRESPTKIVDLDTGDVYRPDWDNLPWYKAGEPDVYTIIAEAEAEEQA